MVAQCFFEHLKYCVPSCLSFIDLPIQLVGRREVVGLSLTDYRKLSEETFNKTPKMFF